jgi:TolA-binding protein
MKAFRDGDYASADDLLGRFMREMPADPRVEDACFLRAVANARQGKKANAADIARTYLARFPRGLRRPEAERIAAQGGTLQK